jgi:hypothetical protein
MTTYTAHFRGDAEFASHDFEAGTADEALALAIKFNADDSSDLWFEHYAEMPVNEIVVCDPDENELAVWHSNDLRLRLAAHDLLSAAERILNRWQNGDIGEVIHELAVAVAKAKGGVA